MTKKQDNPKPTDQGIFVTEAKSIGVAAGKIAKIVGVEPEAPEPLKSQKIAKLTKKNKHRLPRRQKKAQQTSAPVHV